MLAPPRRPLAVCGAAHYNTCEGGSALVPPRSRSNGDRQPDAAPGARRAAAADPPRARARGAAQRQAVRLLSDLIASDGGAPLDQHQLARLARTADVQIFAPGEFLCQEGDASDAVFLIVAGEVEVRQRGSDHAHVIEPGQAEFIGEIGVVENQPRSATVVARSTVQALRFSKEAFLSLVSTAPFLVWKLVRNISSRLRLREQEYLSQLQLRNQELAVYAAQLQDMNNALEQLVAQRTRELAEANGRLEALVATDDLTGLYNRRFLHQLLAQEANAPGGAGRPFSLIMIDVDHFKLYNDRNGHLAGDAVLRQVAGLLQAGVRGSDIVARYGGEEFCVVLDNAPKADALHVAEALRRRIRDYPFPDAARQPLGAITISLGVATYPDDVATVLETLNGADLALYQAKDAGRDHVRGTGPPLDPPALPPLPAWRPPPP